MLIQFSNTGGVGLVNERVINSANCCTSIYTSEAIDGEDLGKPRLLTCQRLCAIIRPRSVTEDNDKESEVAREGLTL